jgi:cleavage and polyadenylation specificity factor subunit 4
MMSSSVPKIDRDWEAEFLFEEDYVPGALANEVLTPAEKARRGSTTNTLRAQPTDLEPSTDSIPMAATKFGSPAAAASPSRWGSFFQKQREEEGLEFGSSSYGTSSARRVERTSAFGHVGSPLRNSSLANAISSELKGSFGNGRPDSASRHDSSNESLSALTQQIQRTRLGDDTSANSSPRLHPQASRPVTGAIGTLNAAGIIGREREKERGLERHVSSGSIGSSGRFTTPIDEEDPAFVFSMEEDEAQVRSKRASGGQVSAASPLGVSTWSYAAVAGNRGADTASANGSGARNGGVPTKKASER